MSWEVEYTDEFGVWLSDLDEDDQEKVTAAVETLEEHGPNLKRPRILFAFDPRRAAILLLGGDKSGNWDRWYEDSIPRAESLYAVHLQELRDEGQI